MNRRQMITAIGLGAVAPRLAKDYEPVGFMDVDRWFFEHRGERGYTVLLDGVDVLKDCVWFNDITGEVCRNRRDSDGHLFMDQNADAIANEILRGEVRMVKIA